MAKNKVTSEVVSVSSKIKKGRKKIVSTPTVSEGKK